MTASVIFSGYSTWRMRSFRPTYIKNALRKLWLCVYVCEILFEAVNWHCLKNYQIGANE